MPLLDLPPEIFDPIIAETAKAAGIRDAFGHRLVCKTFDSHIVDHYVKVACAHSFTGIFNDWKYQHIFEYHGGAILSRKALQTHKSRAVFVRFIKQSMGYLLRSRGDAGEDIEKIKDQLRPHLCNALMALDPTKLREYLTRERRPDALYLWSPADLKASFAAATGDISMLKENLSLPNLLPPHCELYPNALGAAVATSQIEALNTILAWMSKNVRDKRESGSWEEMRSAMRTIGSALRTAIRLHKTDAGRAIFSFLANHYKFRESATRFFSDQLIKDCMRYGNVNLIYGCFVYDRTESYDPNSKVQPKFRIAELDEVFLFKHGHPSALHALIKHGLFDPQHCKQVDPPLHYALSKRNYDMARILLVHGADINAVSSKRGGRTALCFAAQNGHVEDVEFLLEHGASPFARVKETALELARGYHHNKCTFLLEKVEKYGKEYLERPDLWDICELETAERHLGDYQ